MINKIKLLLFCCLITIPVVAQQTIGLFQNSPESLNGYTLFGNNKTTYLIDNCGFTVNTWESDYMPGLATYLLENGSLLRTGKLSGSFGGGGIGGVFERWSWAGDLEWSYTMASNTQHPHHDIEPLPNGNFLAILWDKYTQSEAQAEGRQYNGEVWSERIVEIEILDNNQANIVWEWRLWDHLIQDVDNSKPNFGTVANHPELVDINYIGTDEDTAGDWIHLNAITYNTALKQIAVSARNFSEIWIIDHSTSTAEAASHTGGNAGKGGDLLYRFGNPQTYDKGAVAEQLFFKQHDVRWIPEGYPQAGKMMVFNNEKTSNQSSIEIWSPPINTNQQYEISNGVYGPDAIDWTYMMPGFYSKNMSGAQPLPNGNILVCEASDGLFFELTPAKERVWKYINPVNQNGGPSAQGASTLMLMNDVFRATRYAADYPAFEGRDLTPQSPVEINPWDSDCEIYDTIIAIDAAESNQGIKVWGNPFEEILVIQTDFNNEKKGQIYTMTGQLVKEVFIQKGLNGINLNSLHSGVYVLKIEVGQGKGIIKMIVKK